MSKRLKQYHWNLDSRTEILLKQLTAYTLQAVGFNLEINLQQIKHGPFVYSKSDKSTNYEDLPPPFINDQNMLIFNHLLHDMSYTKVYKDKFNSGDGEEDDDSIFDNNIEKLLPLRTHPVFEKFKSDDIGLSLFQNFKNIHLDSILLKFLISKKYNLDRALTSFIESLNWKINHFQTDKILNESDELIFQENANHKIIENLKIGHIYYRGKDKWDRIVMRIEVRKHFRSNCPDKDLEKIVIWLIETGILSFKESKKITKGTIFFDLTGFTLANADLHIVKFLATQFEANYPEYLGLIIIHNAPKIFFAVWKIIKYWLDPILVEKVRFTYNDELKQFIDEKYIPKSLGGKDTYKVKYIEPKSSLKPIDNSFKKLYHQRCTLSLQFIESTIKWITSETKQESYNYLVQRLQLQQALCKNYLEIDPYVRTRGLYDRNGVLDISL